MNPLVSKENWDKSIWHCQCPHLRDEEICENQFYLEIRSIDLSLETEIIRHLEEIEDIVTENQIDHTLKFSFMESKVVPEINS